MKDIIAFAAMDGNGLVCCNHGKHRSVAAGKILQRLFHRKVSWRYAARCHSHECCLSPVDHNIDTVCLVLRSLSPLYENEAIPDLLSSQLRLM